MKQKKILSNIFVYFTILVLMICSVYAAQSPVNLGTAGDFVILAKSGISTTGTTSIVGDMGVSPIDSTAITGFGLIMDSSNQYATSSLVTGKVYAADYTPPTPTKMTTAISDMQTAYTDAAGRTLPDATELGAGNIDGMTLAPGLYKWGTGVTIPNGVTLSGGGNDVWIFQIAQDLTVGNGAIISLSGGAQSRNIFWQVAGETTLGTTSAFKGNILSQTAIILNTGAALNGRALAQTAVTLDANEVSLSVTSIPVVIEEEPIITEPNTGNSGGTGDSINWSCSDWSICNSEGIQTKYCTQSDSPDTSTRNQVCTPPNSSASTSDSNDPLLIDSNTTVQTEIPSPDNNGTIPLDGILTESNQTANQAVEQNKYTLSWVVILLILLAIIGLIVGGYFYLKK